MAQRKSKFHIFAPLVVVFLIILVLASFSFTIAFSARADNGKRLLQNPVYGSVPLVKKFRKIYWYGLIGGVLSCILHAFGWLAVIHWGFLVCLGLLEVVVLFLIGWTTVLIPKHASEALAICSSPREWPRRPDRLHDVFASLGMKSLDTMQLTAGCNSMMKQWRWSVAVLALNTSAFFLIFFIGYLWVPFINVTAFAWQWLRRNSHRPVQRSPKEVSLPLEQQKQNPANGDASVKHQRFSFESIRSKLSQNLHYADVADFYRETTLSDIPSEHVPALRLETCEPGSKTQCWSCGNQICKSCTVKAKTPMPGSTQHLQHCLPYCSRCHFIFLCSRGEKDIEKTGKGCTIPEHAANQSTPAPAKNVVTEEERSLCRTCGRLEREETTKAYERRELVETRRMARNLQCHACSRELNWSKSMGKQPRCWWRCDSCSSTCWWNKHMGING